MLSDTVEETSKRLIAVGSRRRSGRASATILRKQRKDAEVEDAPPVLGKSEEGRRRERRVGCIGEEDGEEGGVGDTEEAG